MKRITFEVDDSFAKEFSHYCLENNTTKKSAIINLLLREIDKSGMMEQYAGPMDLVWSGNFMNDSNYKRLSKLKIEDEEAWDMRENLGVNEKINNYFESDETLKSLINIFNESNKKEFSIPSRLLDHYYYVKFNNEAISYEDFEHLYGIMTFPYISFETLEEIIYSWDTNFWNLYIINPALMKYADGRGLGLFITPMNTYQVVTEYNGLFETLTGYKLFYLWTNEEKIKPIMQNKEILDDSEWFKMLTDDEFQVMFQKIVKFWFDNKEKIKCHPFENSYFEFTHRIPIEIPSFYTLLLEGTDFELVDTKTGWTSGKCNVLEFDLKAFQCIYVDHNEIIFTEEMLENFKDGTFELKMI